MNRAVDCHNERETIQPHARIASRVQSVFQRASSLTSNSASVTPQPSVHHPSVRSRKASQLVSALTCVSARCGDVKLQRLVDTLVKGAISTTELVTALFDADALDDVETVAYLCTIANLIDRHLLALADINNAKLRERAVYELANPTVCQCSEKGATGLARLLETVAAIGRSRVRDDIFDHLLCALLSSTNMGPSIVTESLVLVNPVLSCVTTCFDSHEKLIHLSRWARLAALQPSSSKSMQLAMHDASSTVSRADTFSLCLAVFVQF